MPEKVQQAKFKWDESNPDPVIYLEEEKQRQKKREFLARKLSKFIAERNISFNTKFVFKLWKLNTEDWKTKNTDHLGQIATLRLFMKGKGEKDSNAPAAAATEKTTDEN